MTVTVSDLAALMPSCEHSDAIPEGPLGGQEQQPDQDKHGGGCRELQERRIHTHAPLRAACCMPHDGMFL